MAWFNFFRPAKQFNQLEPPTHSNLLEYLHINKSLSLKDSCILEIQPTLEAIYTPLPQRIFSIGDIELTPTIKIKRYYLIDDDTWLQISYDNLCIHEIILFYWVHAKNLQPSELTQNIQAPLTSLQWEHRGNLFNRCWQPPKQNAPLEITENIYNPETEYKLTSQQMLFYRPLQLHRKEYWLYTLEHHPEEKTYQQTIAQGFSLLEKEILIN